MFFTIKKNELYRIDTNVIMQFNSNSINSILKYLVAGFIIILLLYFGQTLFIPLAHGLFIAIVLYPVCKWLEQHHFSKSLAITLCLLIVLVLFAVLVWLLVLQVNAFRHDLPELKAKMVPSIS